MLQSNRNQPSRVRWLVFTSASSRTFEIGGQYRLEVGRLYCTECPRSKEDLLEGIASLSKMEQKQLHQA